MSINWMTTQRMSWTRTMKPPSWMKMKYLKKPSPQSWPAKPVGWTLFGRNWPVTRGYSFLNHQIRHKLTVIKPVAVID
jgi:hypothetical protein